MSRLDLNLSPHRPAPGPSSLSTGPSAPGAPEHAAERRTGPVELLWDLVFVFAVTQVSTLLARDLSWAGLGRSLMVLALVWWAWSAFVWAANAQDADAPVLRAALLVALLFIFATGLAIPHAFGADGVLFAGTYTGVRLMHLGLYADASRRGQASWAAIAGFAVTVTLGMGLLVAGSLLHGGARVALWSVAAAVDYAGPGWLTRKRLRGLQRVSVAHFAERYGLFVIICLGESIVAIGLAANGRTIDTELVLTTALGLLITVGLWWTYFVQFAAAAEQRLRGHEDPVLAASDAYSYLHLLLVGGIIVFAVGMRVAVRDVGHPLSEAARLALCGGVALYLAGHAAFRLRLMRGWSLEKPIAATASLGVFAIGTGWPGWSVASAVAAIVVLLCVREGTLNGRSPLQSSP
jgi:low temperature requirement protein LtrA